MSFCIYVKDIPRHLSETASLKHSSPKSTQCSLPVPIPFLGKPVLDRASSLGQDHMLHVDYLPSAGRSHLGHILSGTSMAGAAWELLLECTYAALACLILCYFFPELVCSQKLMSLWLNMSHFYTLFYHLWFFKTAHQMCYTIRKKNIFGAISES